MSHPQPRTALALDIGGTKLATAVVDERGNLAGHVVGATHRSDGPESVMKRLFEQGHRSIDESGLTPEAVGISCGGPLDADAGVLVSPLHLTGWNDVPIVDLVQAEFGRPARLDNDASLGALGESRFGGPDAHGTIVFLTLSTGVGGGVVVDGRLHRGAAGNGGEFGHVVVRHDGRPCRCGRHGCLEAYASGTSIAERAREALADDPAAASSALADRAGEPRAEDVVAAALAGDEFARALWADTIDCLASALTDIVNVFEPHQLVLGGGVTNAGPALIDEVRRRVIADAMVPAASSVEIGISRLGAPVFLFGAAAAAFDLLDGTIEPSGSRGPKRGPKRRPPGRDTTR